MLKYFPQIILCKTNTGLLVKASYLWYSREGSPCACPAAQGTFEGARELPLCWRCPRLHQSEASFAECEVETRGAWERPGPGPEQLLLHPARASPARVLFPHLRGEGGGSLCDPKRQTPEPSWQEELNER